MKIFSFLLITSLLYFIMSSSSSSTLNLRDIFSFVVGQFIARSCVIDVR